MKKVVASATGKGFSLAGETKRNTNQKEENPFQKYVNCGKISYNLYWHKHEQLHLPFENSAAGI